ncbi:hypothetical protein ACN38_g522 [Penicillium nordicum]|uniref:Uncharacterized protein n=1 Tax=Penicillium nordicum TaxID=229535 RepID=A0A0M8PD87_9EURO|nr:hypothetical protein ACN38_g522 [Penicillium nordicum]
MAGAHPVAIGRNSSLFLQIWLLLLLLLFFFFFFFFFFFSVSLFFLLFYIYFTLQWYSIECLMHRTRPIRDPRNGTHSNPSNCLSSPHSTIFTYFSFFFFFFLFFFFWLRTKTKRLSPKSRVTKWVPNIEPYSVAVEQYGRSKLP